MNRSNTNPRSFSIDQLRAALGDAGGPARPDYLPDIVEDAARTRQRPAWTLLETWLPMDIAVRRHGVQRTAVLFAVLSLLVALLTAGLVYVGSQRTQPERPLGLPTTPDAWERIAIETPSGTGGVTALAAGPRGLLAVVGVGEDPSELFASTDGHTWNRVPPDRHPPIGVGAGWALVGSSRGFLLSNGDVWFSADGLEWQLLASRAEDPDLRHGGMLGIAAGGPGYVAVGSGNSAWYSTDGSDWSLAQVPPPPTGFFESQGFATPEVEMRDIQLVGNDLVARGTAYRHTEDKGLTAPVIWTSRDGRTWSNVLDPSDGEGPAALAVGPGGFATVIDHMGQLVVRVSADGNAWEQVDVLGPRSSTDADGTRIDLDVSSIAATSAGFVATGVLGPPCLMAGVPCDPIEAVIWTSEDGRSWSRLPSAERFARAGASDVVAWGSRFVAGGSYDGTPAIWISGSP